MITSYYTTRLGVQPFDPDATNIFNRMPNELLANEKTVINNWVVASKDSGNFSRYDRFFGWFLSDRDNALTDWFTGEAATAVNAPIHTPNVGFSFNGTTQYINTLYNPETDRINYGLNVADVGAYSYQNLSIKAAYLFGQTRTAPFISSDINQQPVNNRISFTLNSAGAFYNGDNLFNDKTRYNVSRISSNIELIENGIIVASDTLAPLGIINLNFYVGGTNLNGSLAAPIEATESHFFVGGNLNQTALNTELQILENGLII